MVGQSLDMPSRDALYDQAASHYLDILDRKGKPPKLYDVVESLCDEHKDYPFAETFALLRLPEFDKVLQDRRKRYLIEKAAIGLYVAERASKLSPKVLDRIEAIVDDPDSDVKLKELTDFAKFCVDLDSKVNRTVEDATGTADVSITLNVKNLLLGLPSERRAAVLGRMVQEQAIEIEASDA